MNTVRTRGFTIVELLVVIVVIAILATITITTYKRTQNQARAASLGSSLQQVETSILELTTMINSEQWPLATAFIATSAPSLTTILAPTYTPTAGQTTLIELRKLLPAGVPTISGVDGVTWVYRNNGGVHSPTACDGASDGRKGPLLELSGVSLEVMNQLDKDIDDFASDCGKVRIYQSKLIYQLGFTQRVE
ncbi:MAG: prepilin-type N-terminal cleavage/methylation domain-containing protein [Candidatus Saccharimonadales bacterium]